MPIIGGKKLGPKFTKTFNFFERTLQITLKFARFTFDDFKFSIQNSPFIFGELVYTKALLKHYSIVSITSKFDQIKLIQDYKLVVF